MINKAKYLISVIYAIFKAIEQYILKPFKAFLRYIEPITNRYVKLWKEVVYDKWGDFLYKRAVIMIISTLAGIYVILAVLEFVFDVGYYFATKKTETIYLSDSVELDSVNNLWGVKGCPTKDCNSSTALYFRIKTTWFNQIWNIINNHQLFFPDAIAAGVPTGQAECVVTSYGLRYRILMIYNYYPQILQVECKSTL